MNLTSFDVFDSVSLKGADKILERGFKVVDGRSM